MLRLGYNWICKYLPIADFFSPNLVFYVAPILLYLYDYIIIILIT